MINSCDDANYVSTCTFTDRIATDAYFSPKMRLKLNALWQHSWHPSVTFSRKIVLIFKCNYDFGLRVYEENILGGRVIRTALGRLKGRHPFSKETSVYRVNALKLGGGAAIYAETPKAEVTRYDGPITCIGGRTDHFCIFLVAKL